MPLVLDTLGSRSRLVSHSRPGALLPRCLLGIALAVLTSPAQATPLDPLAFTSLGTLTPITGVTVDTDTLQMTGGATFTGVVGPDGIAVFTFDDISIGSGITITATGSRPLALLSQGDASIEGEVRGSALGRIGGPGGGLGGLGGSGSGPGGGTGTSSSSSAGGGGGFGGAGGRSSLGLAGGSAYGDLAVLLQGGSGGGASGGAVGGGGGGALEIGAVGVLSVGAGASLNARGERGAPAAAAAGGGGSGGALLLHADGVSQLGSLDASGGDGPAGSGGLGGGGGGGGRVLVQTSTWRVDDLATGAWDVSGGDGPGAAEDGERGVARLEAGATIIPSGQMLAVSEGRLVNDIAFTTGAVDVGLAAQLALDGSNTLGAVTNAGTFMQTGGELDGSLVNSATASFAGDASVTGQVDNRGQLDVTAGASLAADTLLNSGTLDFDGTLVASSVTNQLGGHLSGSGTIDGNLTNDGVLDPTGPLAVSGTLTNGVGSFSLQTGESLRADGGITNTAVAELAGGVLAPSGGGVTNGAGGVIRGSGAVGANLANTGGLIHANGVDPLVVADLSGGSSDGGELRVADGSTLLVQSAFSSSGTVVLQGPDAALSGGPLTNSGTVRGTGRLSNTVANLGVIRAEGGQLTLSGAANTNGAAGRIDAPTGSTVFYSQGLSSNEGTIALSGGAFDGNGRTLANAGEILGRGTLRTGGLTNTGTVEFADGDSDVFGTVTNEATLNVTENTTTFFDLVSNGPTGTIKNTGATARFLGGLVNSGAFVSDPADNHFTDILLDETGYLVGGEGDRFLVTGDLLSSSEMSVLWDTLGAELALIGGGTHRLRYSGLDLGASRRGYADNMAWGVLRLGEDDEAVLEDGDETPGGALYVKSLVLEGGLEQIAAITGNGISIYYDPLSADNAAFAGRSWALPGGGVLAPVPEPSTALLLGAGIAALASRRRSTRK